MEELDARRTDQVLAPLVEEPPDVLLSLVAGADPGYHVRAQVLTTAQQITEMGVRR